MKAAVLLVAAAGAVLAQNFSGEPACATACLSSAIVAAGCALSDQGCQCNSATQAALVTLAGPCLISNCSGSDLAQAQSAGSALCVAYSATATGITYSNTTTTTAKNSTITPAPTTTGSSGNAGTTTTGGSNTSKTTSSSTGAGATPIMVGAGALAALMGVVVAL